MPGKTDLRENAPWKQRFRATSIAWARVAARNPARGLAVTNRSGVSQLYAWKVPTGRLTQVTHAPAGVANGMISPDGRSIIYHKDVDGDEIGHYVRIPFEGGEPQNITPGLPPYPLLDNRQSRSGNLISLTLATTAGYQIFAVSPDGARRLIFHSEHYSAGGSLSHNGELAAVATTERSGTADFSAVAIDTASGQRVGELWDGEGTSVRPGDFAPLPGDLRLFGTTNQSGHERPLLWNPATGERRDLAVDHLAGDVIPWDWSLDGKRLLLNQIHQARHQLHIYDLQSDTTTRLEQPEGIPGGFTRGYFMSSGEIFTIWQDSVTPPCLIALDSVTGRKTRTLLPAGETPAGRPWRSITYTSENGAQIQGWLATPPGPGPYPTILHTHGGPQGVMSAGFHPESQAWLDHGFAFLTINFHGSTTFGKDFERAIWGNLGHLEVDDMAGAYHWLVDEGIAHPKAVFLRGGSYGGYLTLLALGKRPDLWAGGMASKAIADWRLLYEDESPRMRGYQRAMFGGTPEELPDVMAASSPISYAERVEAPILVIQGRNDSRCAPRQMSVYQDRMEALGKPIQVHWVDFGHKSRAQAQRIQHQELMLRFAFKTLKTLELQEL